MSASLETIRAILKEVPSVPARKFTKKANTVKKQRQWEHVYESAKKAGASPGEAVRRANGVIARAASKRKAKRG